jgi:hypothetical protein
LLSRTWGGMGGRGEKLRRCRRFSMQRGFENRGGRIRTDDHLNPIQVRYQAALRPDATNRSGALHSIPQGAAGFD